MSRTLTKANQITVLVSGMDCANCAATVETALRKMPQVEEVEVSVARERAQIVLTESDAASLEQVQQTIRKLGYGAEVQAPVATESKDSLVSMPVGGMDCASCALTVEKALSGIEGISDITVSVSRETASFHHDPSRISAKEIQNVIRKLGYEPGTITAAAMALADEQGHACNCGHDHSHEHDQNHTHTHTHEHSHHAKKTNEAKPGSPASASFWRNPKAVLTIRSAVALLLAYAATLVNETVGHYAFIAATIFALYPIAKRAFVAARFGAIFTIHMLMTLAAIGALIIGEQEEAAIVVFLFMVGELLEGVAADRARSGIKALGKLLPQNARVERDGQEVDVSINALKVGDTVVVRSGDRLPADGVIVKGTSSIDESPVTGESIPVHKTIGDEVLAGTVNHDATLRVNVTKSGADNTISRIIALVEEAQDTKAPIARFIDGFSRIYMPMVIAIAALVIVLPPLLGLGDWQTWIYRGLALLLIGCPCALVISVPAAIASSLASGARHGILLKGGAVIESVAKTTLVVFDKTGTLTRGVPVVTDTVPVNGTEADLLEAACAVERESTHPLAKAILEAAEKAGKNKATAHNVRVVPGKGMEGEVAGKMVFIGAPRFAVERTTLDDATASAIKTLEAQGKSVAVAVKGDVLLGYFAMRDEPRDNASESLAALGKMGVDALMLTGDNASTGQAIGQQLGIKVQAEMLPEDKAAKVRFLSASGHVLMVGDGVNDAPALAQAHVGVAMGAGTDIAMEASDAALMRNDISDVNRMIGLSRATMANIRQNVSIALGLKAVFLVTTITGISGLWMAIMADTGATVLVTLNAMRLLGFLKSDNR